MTAMASTTENGPSKTLSMRKNGPKARSPEAPLTTSPGKNWHQERKPFRPAAGLTSYAKRLEVRKMAAEVKALEAEMKEEKDAKRQVSPSPLII
jgi:hypothetical protein